MGGVWRGELVKGGGGEGGRRSRRSKWWTRREEVAVELRERGDLEVSSVSRRQMGIVRRTWLLVKEEGCV